MVKIITIVSLFFGLYSFAADDTIDLNQFKDIRGQSIALKNNADKVFLYFWAHWCPECEGKFNKFFPENINKIQTPIITINTDSKEKKVLGFIEKNNVTLPVIMDTEKIFRKFSKVNGVPGWALLSKEKNGTYKLVQSKTGFDEAEVRVILNIK